MKNIVLASLLGFGLISSAWATETVNIHERVNNAQAPAHQMQSAAAPVGIQGTAPRMAGMDQHEQAIIAHETMTKRVGGCAPENGGKSSEDDGKSDRFPYRAVEVISGNE